MGKKVLILMFLLVFIISLCTACNQTEQKDQTSNNKPKTTENKQQAKNENNADKMLEVLKTAAESIEFGESHSGYGLFWRELGETYDDSVKNPYTNETAIHVLNRDEGILDEQDIKFSRYSASIAIIDVSMDFLKNVEKNEVTYGCNPNNKGVVMGFVYQDGFYIYQVDENGEKQNEITYIFPGYEYPEWVDEYKE